MDIRERDALNEQIRMRLWVIGWRYEAQFGRFKIYNAAGELRGYSKHTLNGAWMECRKEVEALEAEQRAKLAVAMWNAKVAG